MDLKAFSEEQFNVKDWLNQTFKQPEAQQNKEQYASSLVLKLQLLIAKLNASLEEQSESVAQNMPRVVRDADSLQQEAKLLQAKMAAVQEEIEKVNRETASSMETLVTMDLLKERMQATRRALKEADNWTTLSTEIEDALDSGDLDVISEKLAGIQSSLKILSHVPDYEDRVIHVEGLKNRLEALASPQLVAAFNQSDSDRARFFVSMFKDMERSDQLLKYYRKCLKAKLLKVWERTLEERQHQTLLEWAKVYFAATEDTLKTQMSWFQSVFTGSNASENLLLVILEVLHTMEPKFEFCLEAALKQHLLLETQEAGHSQNPMFYLRDVKQVFNGHAEAVDSLLSPGVGPGNANLREYFKTLYVPFKQHIRKYGSWEASYLLEEVKSGKGGVPPISKDIIDELRNVSLAMNRMVVVFTEASKRCCEITEGCSYPELLPALDSYLTAFLERFSTLMRRLDKRKGSSNNWSILQQSLTLTQTMGEVLLQLEQLDITMAIDFLDKTKCFLGPDSKDRANEQHHLFLLDAQGIVKLEEFYSTVEKGVNYPVLSSCLALVSRLCAEMQHSAFAIIFHSVSEELNGISELGVWNSPSAGSESTESDMPDFSFSPQEYITQIGQYLMTLPQHLEPYMTNENPALARAFHERVFPHCSGVLLESNGGSNHGQTPADFILACISKATCETYQSVILKIPSLTPNSAKQLATDIGYLGDILQDLGHGLSDGLTSVLMLLRLPAKDYWVQSTGCPQKLVSAVRQMRNLSVK